jgi:tripartite-type tricarboxylate transporter receptor subunit TctC
MLGSRIVAVVLLGLALVAGTDAQAWPQKPVRVIVPFPPGGTTDSIARIAGEWLTSRLGQPVLAENKPGASGVIAAELVARAQPDGYTLFMAPLPQMVIVPQISKTPYDPFKDFVPISIVASNDFALAVSERLPVATLGELIAYARERPGALSYASAGAGTVSHLTMALLLKRAGVDMVHVPYKGGGPALGDLVAGHVPLYFGNFAEVLAHVRGGKLKVLATSGERRATAFPGVATVAEQGFPGFRTNTWNGLAAPAGAAPAIVERIASEIALATKDPMFVKRLEGIGAQPVGNTPSEFAATLKADFETWREAIRASGIKIE